VALRLRGALRRFAGSPVPARPAPAVHATDTTEPNHPAYVQFPAALLIIFVLMFVTIARDPARFRHLIPFGVLLKKESMAEGDRCGRPHVGSGRPPPASRARTGSAVRPRTGAESAGGSQAPRAGQERTRNVFELHRDLVASYAAYIRSFIAILDPRLVSCPRAERSDRSSARGQSFFLASCARNASVHPGSMLMAADPAGMGRTGMQAPDHLVGTQESTGPDMPDHL
jgi:hypothetical protein